MYEIWTNQQTPNLRLVKPQGTPFPAPRSGREWTLLGVASVDPAIAAIVEREGFEEVTSTRPFNPEAMFSADPGDLARADTPR